LKEAVVPALDPRSCFEAFLRAVNTRDGAALDQLAHPDFEEVYLQSGERIRGIQNLRAILDNYPDGYEERGPDRVVGSEDRWVMTPALTMLRVEGAGDTFTGVSKARYPDGSEWYVIHIGEIRDGRVWRVQSFFAPLFDAPAWRAGWVEAASSAER
jgi:hypothetical protein